MIPVSLPTPPPASQFDVEPVTDAGSSPEHAHSREALSGPSRPSDSYWHRCSKDFDRCTLVELRAWVWLVMLEALHRNQGEPWCHHASRAKKAQAELNKDRPDPGEIASIRAWLHDVRRDADALTHDPAAGYAQPLPSAADNVPARDGIVPGAMAMATSSRSTAVGEELNALLKFRSALPKPAQDLLRDIRFISVPAADLAVGTAPTTSIGKITPHGPQVSLDEARGRILVAGNARQWAALEIERHVLLEQPGRDEVSAIWLAVAHMLETVASPRGREDQFLRALHQEERVRGGAEAPTREALAVWLLARALTGHWPKDHRAVRFLRRFLGPPDGGQAWRGGS